MAFHSNSNKNSVSVEAGCRLIESTLNSDSEAVKIAKNLAEEVSFYKRILLDLKLRYKKIAAIKEASKLLSDENILTVDVYYLPEK